MKQKKPCSHARSIFFRTLWWLESQNGTPCCDTCDGQKSFKFGWSTVRVNTNRFWPFSNTSDLFQRMWHFCDIMTSQVSHLLQWPKTWHRGRFTHMYHNNMIPSLLYYYILIDVNVFYLSCTNRDLSFGTKTKPLWHYNAILSGIISLKMWLKGRPKLIFRVLGTKTHL